MKISTQRNSLTWVARVELVGQMFGEFDGKTIFEKGKTEQEAIENLRTYADRIRRGEYVYQSNKGTFPKEKKEALIPYIVCP